MSLNVDSTPRVGIRSPKAKSSDSCLLYQKRNLIVKRSPPNPELPFASILISETEPLCLLLARNRFKKKNEKCGNREI